jgi:hypothetical protein
VALVGLTAASAIVLDSEVPHRSMQEVEEEKECYINVEILHRTTCLQYNLYVDAPVHRRVHLLLADGPTHDYDAENETCRATYAPNPSDEEEPLVGLLLQQGPGTFSFYECVMAGRPFLDAAGTMQKTKIIQTSVPVWSAPSSALETPDSKLSADFRSKLGEEWKRRAVGEYASIASFAAFTIGLMANQSPPDLIQDSLTAAMDEVRHAQVSFERASLLTGTTIEPGPLPPSQLEFGNNLTTLALGVAREGCIDETLSALALAALMNDTKLGNDKLLKLLLDNTSQIAKEEGSHAVLAWRTIHWVCSVDPQDACVIVEKEVLNPKYLKMAVQARFTGELGETLEKASHTLHEQLVPMVTNRKKVQPAFVMAENAHDGEIFRLTHSIMNGVREALSSNSMQME